MFNIISNITMAKAVGRTFNYPPNRSELKKKKITEVFRDNLEDTRKLKRILKITHILPSKENLYIF